MFKNRLKLQFVRNFNKEAWFIETKFEEAKKFIGRKRFTYIVNQNIPNCHNNNKKIFYKNIKTYIKTNKNNIVPSIKQEGNNLEKRWKKFEKNFFKQMEEITQIKWKYKTYKIYLLYSCLWGGDYDINKPNIYINPLLKYGDTLYIIFHELSHLLYWEYIYSKYSSKFIKKNYNLLWQLSEVLVNYPLLKLKIKFKFPIIIPRNLLKFSKPITKKFSILNFINIIDEEIKMRVDE